MLLLADPFCLPSHASKHNIWAFFTSCGYGYAVQRTAAQCKTKLAADSCIDAGPASARQFRCGCLRACSARLLNPLWTCLPIPDISNQADICREGRLASDRAPSSTRSQPSAILSQAYVSCESFLGNWQPSAILTQGKCCKGNWPTLQTIVAYSIARMIGQLSCSNAGKQ